METLNIKPLSEEQWSPETPNGMEATGLGGPHVQGPASMASTSSEERAIRRVMGRWGPEWLS